MTNHFLKSAVIIALISAVLPGCGGSILPDAVASQDEALPSLEQQWQVMHNSAAKDRGREIFNEKKYGMFIHWGLYAHLGGMWKGETMEASGTGPTVAEWVMRRKEIPRAEYAALASEFNPVDFDADAWVAIAKAAGMKYMVITAKHHDGFAMFDSDVSDFNIVDATPFGRDVIAELQEACEKAGLSFGVYYSHGSDWQDGGDGGLKDYAPENPPRTVFANTWDPSPVSFDDYLEYKAKPQVRELLNNYKLSQIWFDSANYIPEQDAFDFYNDVYKANPEILTNSRLGHNFGDIGTPRDNEIPGAPLETIWEGIATTNHSWGYKVSDTDFKPPVELLFWLVENVSKGGNFLLNVGPDERGNIPVQAAENLKVVGDWLAVNGEAIYGTSAWSTTKEGPTNIVIGHGGDRKNGKLEFEFEETDFWFTQKGNKVYAISLSRPQTGFATVKAFKSLNIKSIRQLGATGDLVWAQTGEGIDIALQPFTRDGYGYVLEVTLYENSITQNNLPEFHWDTMPLYMHLRKDTAFTNKEITYLAKFPLITFEKTTGRKTYGSTEEGTIAAAKAVKRINPKAKILYYKNVVVNWGGYKEDESFLKRNPDALLFDQSGKKALMPNQKTGFFDISKKHVRSHWIDHVSQVTSSPYIDGVFLDANIKVLVPGFFAGRVGPEKQKDIMSGYFTMMEDLNTQLANNNLLIANILRVRPEFKDVGREYLKYFDGSYIEGFEHENFDMTYEDYLAKGIDAVQKSAREGKVIAMSMGIGKALENAETGIDDTRKKLRKEDSISERIDYLLAIFLVCAEKYSYVYPHDGYGINNSAVWLQTFPQYERKLGTPEGPARKEGYVYTRSFEHLDVWLDIKNKKAQLDWR